MTKYEAMQEFRFDPTEQVVEQIIDGYIDDLVDLRSQIDYFVDFLDLIGVNSNHISTIIRGSQEEKYDLAEQITSERFKRPSITTKGA